MPQTGAQASTGQGQGYDRGMPAPPRIRIPRWVQLVVLPVLLVFAFLLARTLGHVIFLFLTAAVIAFTLNPLVRDLTRLRLPRGLSVAVVSIVFAAAVIGLLVALGTVVVSETRTAAERIDNYLTEDLKWGDDFTKYLEETTTEFEETLKEQGAL